MKQANVIVTFGTSHEDTKVRTIDRLIADTAAVWPEACVRVAYTSPTIRRILAGRGEEALSLTEVLEQLSVQEVEQVRLCVTHLICGEEFDKLRVQAGAFRDRFQSLTLSRPLLTETEDIRGLVHILNARFPRREGCAVLFMGHGTRHYSNTVYAALDYMCRALGRGDFHLATVDGYPFLEDVLPQLLREGIGHVLLTPLMLVAGDHAKNDMAGNSAESWKSRLEEAGFTTEAVMKGLGEYPEVRRMYLEHFRQAAPL